MDWLIETRVSSMLGSCQGESDSHCSQNPGRDVCGILFCWSRTALDLQHMNEVDVACEDCGA